VDEKGDKGGRQNALRNPNKDIQLENGLGPEAGAHWCWRDCWTRSSMVCFEVYGILNFASGAGRNVLSSVRDGPA